MANYTYEELERLANAVRNVWAANYNMGFLPGMSSPISNTGEAAFLGLQGSDVIEVIGGGLFSGLPLRAIIAMKDFGHEAALRIQDGYGPFDMKPGFLRAAKKKGKKYFIMSFRHMTPGSSKTLGKVMSPSVHKAAMNSSIKRGESFSDQIGTKEDPSDFGLMNSKGYEWQNGPYAGMINTAKSKEGKRHSQYRTFRVISENSSPSSWWHPGVDPNDVIGATVNYATPYIQEGVKRAAKAEVVQRINKIFSQPLSV